MKGKAKMDDAFSRRELFRRAARGILASGLLAGGFLLYLRRSANRHAQPDDLCHDAVGACSRCSLANACGHPTALSYRAFTDRKDPMP